MTSRFLAVFLACILAILPQGAWGQESALRQTTSIGYWPAAVTFPGPGGSASWTTSFFTFEYQGEAATSPLGLRLQYAVGVESAWSIPLSSGQDTIWGIDLTYRQQFQAQSLPDGSRVAAIRWALGYGSLRWDNTDALGAQLIQTTSGFRVGGDAVLPFQDNWSLTANVAWYPGARTTLVAPALASEDSASGSGVEYGAAVRYSPGPWFVDVGYRGASVSYGTLSGGAFAGGCPCSTTWSGFVMRFGGSF